uniref:Uncharacterized protein n=1 Tax=Salix viminalis TaxID=40686 RepID=A0A6N2L624_SALVM
MKKIEDSNTLVFIVDLRAGKKKIEDAVKKMHDIQTKKVNTLIRKYNAFLSAVGDWLLMFESLIAACRHGSVVSAWSLCALQDGKNLPSFLPFDAHLENKTASNEHEPPPHANNFIDASQLFAGQNDCREPGTECFIWMGIIAPHEIDQRNV